MSAVNSTVPKPSKRSPLTVPHMDVDCIPFYLLYRCALYRLGSCMRSGRGEGNQTSPKLLSIKFVHGSR